MKITVETVVDADLKEVWNTWNNPDDIVQWNSPSNDWHTTRSAVDLREVSVEFDDREDGVVVRETFDAESENSPEMQRAGWQAILDNFGRHVEKH
jgi:uncharacterized protein YndB with AHSA1/START domain